MEGVGGEVKWGQLAGEFGTLAFGGVCVCWGGLLAASLLRLHGSPLG